ncbi:MAG: AMP-binding protein, partial [Acidimicrobiia bacterium]
MSGRADELTYDTIRARFEWRIPERFNMGVACSSAHDPERRGLIAVDQDGSERIFTFGDLDRLSNRLANALAELGVEHGDRVGVVVPQSLETGIAHLAIWKLGAISLPLADLFGPDALSFRLEDSGAKLVIATPESLRNLDEAAPNLPKVFTGTELDQLIKASSDVFTPRETDAEDPAYLI